MARPKDKKQLQELSSSNFSLLITLVDEIDKNDLDKSGVNANWSVKDILAHLHEWHKMSIAWYSIGIKGVKPAIPSEKYTWKDTPQLNEDIFNQYKAEDSDSILKKLKKSHKKIMEIIDSHNDDELFTKKKYVWTGTTSMGAYFVSATSSHYDWAIKLIKKWQKNNG